LNSATALQAQGEILSSAVEAVESFDTKTLVESTLQSNPQEIAEILEPLAEQTIEEMGVLKGGPYPESVKMVMRSKIKRAMLAIWLHGIAVGLEINSVGEQIANKFLT